MSAVPPQARACGHAPSVRAPAGGFTLLELLVVTAILGVVLATIGAGLAGGLKVWDAARGFNRGESEALQAMELMEQDLVNAFDFYDLGFDGGESLVAFPRVVAGGDDGSLRIGTVRYAVDEREGALVRTVSPYPAGEVRRETVLRELKSFELDYYTLRGAGEPGSPRRWQDAGNQVTGFPARVDIRIAIGDDRLARRLARTVLLQEGMHD